MGDILENEDPFQMTGKKNTAAIRRPQPHRDETLYDL
jgi:hypothetical protein